MAYNGIDKRPGIALYGEKKLLINYLEIRSSSFNEDANGRINVQLPYDLAEKYKVPMKGSIQNRLDWLAGVIDGDGHTQYNPDNANQITICIGSIHLSFLQNIRYMLHTLGVSSVINLLRVEGDKIMPDGKGGTKEYYCQTCYRICISALGVSTLIKLGLNTHRIKVDNHEDVKQDNRHYVTIQSIEKTGRKDATYCFNEPKRHMGIFNGVITGNCSEIMEYSNQNSYATCLTGETKILTENGLKRIDECNNETVLSYFSDDKNLIKKPTFVKSELINNGEKEVYSISFLNSRKITATKDHLFLIRTGRKQSIKSDTYEWRKLENIKKGDNIVLPANDVLPGYDINIKINVDDEYAVAGWMIGDGWQRAVKENNNDTITLNYGVCFGKYDDYAKDKMIPILNNIQQTQQSICKRSIKEYSDKKGTTCWQTKQYSFAKYFKDKYGFEEHLGPAKIIPNKIHNSSPNMKASFLSGLFSADGTVFIQSHFNISLSSASIELLYEVQEMLRCFGIHSKVQYSYIKSRDRSQGNVIIHGIQNIKRFLKYIGFTLSPTKQEKLEKGINTFNYERNRSINEYITVSNIEYAGKQQVYDLHVPETHNFITNGVISHNCNLASIALPSYIAYDGETGVPYYDFKKLHDIAQVITRNINKVIDRTFYPVPETESNNKQHRPIGIGVQGLANTFAMMRMPFDSPEAAQLNKDIFETIYHGALTASMLIAKRREEMRTELDTPGIILKRKREIMKYLQLIPEEVALTKYRGAYSSFDGSPASQGLLQFDLWGAEPGGVLWNWNELKAEIAKYGIRNSLLLAPMPTASTSQILGFNESIEPFTSNIYQRQTLAGEFVIINKHLIKDLLDAGLWNTEMKNRVFMAGGSIQGITEIPENIRELYKTGWEMKQKVLIDQSADRGIYVCQSQSLNLFVEDPEFSKLSNMHFYGWKRGLKTGVYYLRTRPRAKITAFTIEPPKLVNTTSSQDITQVVGSSNLNVSPQRAAVITAIMTPPPVEPPTEEQIMACRLDNPEGCLMCGS